MNIAAILAGGVGSRLGANVPKQFVEILGKPIIAYTIELFNDHPEIDAVLVICVQPYMDYIWELKERYGFEKLRWVTDGGSTFQESVINGVGFLSDRVDDNDTVLFQFSASPFTSPDIISDAIRVCKKTGTNAISATDYLYLSGKKKTTATVMDPDNYTEEYIDRNTVAVMNTPHAFQYGFISDMYDEAVRTGLLDTVEPHTTTLMYAMGKRINFSKGSQCNIKITTQEDLELFEGFILEKQRKDVGQASGDVIVLLADGFEECEALLVVDLLGRAGLKVIMASIMGRCDVRSSRGILIQADCLAGNVDFESAKMLVLPGGRAGARLLSQSDIVIEQCVAFNRNRYLAAVCAAPSILASLKLMEKATVHPDYVDQMGDVEVFDEDVIVDGNVITGRALGATIPFALTLIETLAGKEAMEKVRVDIFA